MGDEICWFRKQFYKYFSFGFFSSLLTLFFCSFFLGEEIRSFGKIPISSLGKIILWEISEKAVFSLSILGVIALFAKYLFPKVEKAGLAFFIDLNKMTLVLFSSGVLLFYGTYITPDLIKGFGVVWLIAFFCIIPIDLIFQLSSRFRSNRNMIYLMYILICLLDSHFEGRIKIFLKFINI